MTELNIEQLKAAALAATPGEWSWRQSTSGRIDLAAPHGGGTVVMDFCRHGMKGAQPRFALCPDGLPRGKRGGILYPASELILSDPDRLLRHPDAAFIAAANPPAVLELIAEVERLRSAQGSAEPIGDIVELFDAPYCGLQARINLTAKLPQGAKLYTALPALVSAEPVNFKDALRWSKANLDYHGYIAFTPDQLKSFVGYIQSAPPSTDAKDSERLAEAIKRMDRARNILTKGNPTPECNWGMLDTSDLVKP